MPKIDVYYNLHDWTAQSYSLKATRAQNVAR